jgi:hypothetical protein
MGAEGKEDILSKGIRVPTIILLFTVDQAIIAKFGEYNQRSSTIHRRGYI